MIINLFTEGGLVEFVGHAKLLRGSCVTVEGSEFAIADLGDRVQVERVQLLGVAAAVGHGGVGRLQRLHLGQDVRLEVLELSAHVGGHAGEENTGLTRLEHVGDPLGESLGVGWQM